MKKQNGNGDQGGPGGTRIYEVFKHRPSSSRVLGKSKYLWGRVHSPEGECIILGDITSFIIMCGNQAVAVVAVWACYYSRDEILKFP